MYEAEICAHEMQKSEGLLTKTDRGTSTKKARKSAKNVSCVDEGEYVHMLKGKSKGFRLKLIGGPLQKRLENHQKSNLCL